MKTLSYILIVVLLIVSVGCGLNPVERETTVAGTVHLNTGESVVNYPLQIKYYAPSGAWYGKGALSIIQDLRTDAKGAFFYKGLFKSGFSGGGYELGYAVYFKIGNTAYTVDSLQADIPDYYTNGRVNYNYEGYLYSGKNHSIKIILKK
jgi:hypothetical protein